MRNAALRGEKGSKKGQNSRYAFSELTLEFFHRHIAVRTKRGQVPPLRCAAIPGSHLAWRERDAGPSVHSRAASVTPVHFLSLAATSEMPTLISTSNA